MKGEYDVPIGVLWGVRNASPCSPKSSSIREYSKTISPRNWWALGIRVSSGACREEGPVPKDCTTCEFGNNLGTLTAEYHAKPGGKVQRDAKRTNKIAFIGPTLDPRIKVRILASQPNLLLSRLVLSERSESKDPRAKNQAYLPNLGLPAAGTACPPQRGTRRRRSLPAKFAVRRICPE